MTQPLNALIIENQPLLIEVYKNALDDLSLDVKNIRFHINVVRNYNDALKKIKNKNSVRYDVVFLDMNIKHSNHTKTKLISGQDVGNSILKKYPKTKLIVLTTNKCHYTISDILKYMDPISVLVKNEINYSYLKRAIISVLNDAPFYSKTVIHFLKDNRARDLNLDHIDRRLLYELSRGTKTKDLPKVIPLSLAGIERRKRILKEVLNGIAPGTNNIIEVARLIGLV